MLQQGTRRTSCSERQWPWRISISIGKLLIKADGAIYPLSIFHFLPFLQLLNFRSSVSDLGSQHSKSHSQFTWNWNSVHTNWNMNLSSMQFLPLNRKLAYMDCCLRWGKENIYLCKKLESWTFTLPLSVHVLLCSLSSHLIEVCWSKMYHEYRHPFMNSQAVLRGPQCYTPKFT